MSPLNVFVCRLLPLWSLPALHTADVCRSTGKGLQNKVLAARVLWNASISLSLTGCLCFKALSSWLAVSPPSSSPSLRPGANPPDSTTSSLCPPNLAGLQGWLSALTLSLKDRSFLCCSRCPPLVTAPNPRCHSPSTFE